MDEEHSAKASEESLSNDQQNVPDSEPMDQELSGAFEELIGESPDEAEAESTESVAVSLDEALDNEDIEALFDD